jgi:cation transport ATPase
MPIQVTCPKCFKRFQVSEKFAGKTGPCPNCKQQIKVPEKSEEVVIHAPDDGAPKDRAGKSVLKPLKRTETDVTRKGLLITAGAVLVAVGVAIGFRIAGGAPLWAAVVGAILLGPPLVWAGYSFVRDSELEPYRGTELRNRVLILSGILAALWLLYVFVPSYINDLESPNEMSFVWFGIIFCVMMGLGAVASVASFELEFASGLAHAGLYFIVTTALALLSGIALATV